ncbi:MAG TPA: VIT1/CCC1 transporter family protein [Candidatus Limnocylindrales bacterium]|nr:VIT1/CCC1 transporter family protein [Candidatus Limnocylindrales bacterium]
MAQSQMSPGGMPILHERDQPQGGLGRRLRDIILGGQDGLVNVLGLVLGLFAAGQKSTVIIIGGLAATFAESIAMGGVAYTSALAERDYYLAELARERREVEEVPELEREEVREIFRSKGLKGETLERVVAEITADKDIWVDVMMRDELHLTPVATEGLLTRAALTGVSTFVGSLIPLLPFFFLPVVPATIVAVPLSAIVLFAVGAYKALTLVGDWRLSGLQMLVIGMASAFAGFLIGRLLNANGI